MPIRHSNFHTDSFVVAATRFFGDKRTQCRSSLSFKLEVNILGKDPLLQINFAPSAEPPPSPTIALNTYARIIYAIYAMIYSHFLQLQFSLPVLLTNIYPLDISIEWSTPFVHRMKANAHMLRLAAGQVGVSINATKSYKQTDLFGCYLSEAFYTGRVRSAVLSSLPVRSITAL